MDNNEHRVEHYVIMISRGSGRRHSMEVAHSRTSALELLESRRRPGELSPSSRADVDSFLDGRRDWCRLDGLEISETGQFNGEVYGFVYMAGIAWEPGV